MRKPHSFALSSRGERLYNLRFWRFANFTRLKPRSRILNGLIPILGAIALGAGLVAALRAGPTHELLWGFGLAPFNPVRSNLVLSSDGYYWGTTQFGGARDFGTVFKVRPDASDWTTVLSFTSNGTSNRGAQPVAGLIVGSDGNFYGTTSTGGAGNFGTIFKLTPAGVLTTLVEFTGKVGINHGANPNGRLVEASDGNFYGTASSGGPSLYGTVFKVTSGGALTTLVDFTFGGATNRGRNPQSELIIGSDGLFYGTTQRGGASDAGTVFKVTSAGALTTLAEFNGTFGTLGGLPFAGLVQATDLNYYGATTTGGSANLGTIYRVTSAGGLTTLVEFTDNGPSNKGASPQAGLVQASDLSLYGVTPGGGSTGFGTLFSVTTSGVLTTLLEFTANGATNRGAGPQARLTRAVDGSLYGTTTTGGVNNAGTAFKFSGGVLTTLVDFTDSSATTKGMGPYGALVQASDGTFYGTTNDGGAGSSGTIFKISPTGILTTLVEFTGNGASNKGAGPQAALLLSSDGNFYGTTSLGGVNGLGTVFSMTSAGALTTLVEFTGNSGANKGTSPTGKMLPSGDGHFLGTTQVGGASGFGTIFKMSPAGALTSLVEFTSSGASNRVSGHDDMSASRVRSFAVIIPLSR